MKLVECVPNFSEGRDRGVIDAIVAAIASVEGTHVLDVDPGRDTHRTVVTFVAGATEALARTLGVMRTLNAPGGVALMPARPRDADAVGVRLIDDDWLVQPLPGIGVAGICGEAHRIQFPLVR